MTRYVSIESMVLSLICLADMISTLILVSMGHAVEQNPLMSACLRQGATMFVLAKLASFLPFVVAVEWYRRKKPVFARNAARAAIVLYVCTYIIVTARVNIA